MIPSLVAGEVRRGIVEYLATTFALADEDARDALTNFLEHPTEGIFRGPFLRVRPPFRSVDSDWASPLAYHPADWTADGIRPHRHQGQAWARLAGRTRTPEPTIITTGTGSGKTEGFEIPILDHVLWARDSGIGGVKALILYPMNALVTDQAGRFARRVASDPALNGVRVGEFSGSSGESKAMSSAGVIDHHGTLLDDPPDILLTNYKMLDRLLTRADRKRLWDSNGPTSLRYLVLDEFHTYDGAQGTDVAMLLRRLGARLKPADPTGVWAAGWPLGPAVPVATSATLASTSQARRDLLTFAGRVFGRPFDETAIIGETRLTADEAAGPVAVFRMPDPRLLAKLDESEPEALREAADLFLPEGEGCPTKPDGSIDTVALGTRMRSHHLMRPLLSTTGGQPIAWAEITARVAQTDSQWAAAYAEEPTAVAKALAWFVALISIARRARTDAAGQPKTDDEGSPLTGELFAVEVQVWIRAVSRLLRHIDPESSYRWLDGPMGLAEFPELPAVYCRVCGRSGWAAAASERPAPPDCVGALLHRAPSSAYQASLAHSDAFRTMLSANPREHDVRWLSAETGQQHRSDDSSDTRVPVITMEDPVGAADQRCPSCLNDDSIRFLGSAVTSLASVTVSQLFGSPLVDPDERRLIAFTDSVQDAAHRAGFFTGRAHRFNLRALLSRVLQRQDGPIALDALADSVVAEADTPDARFSILPPDLHRAPAAASLLTDTPTGEAQSMLAERTRLDAALELGLRARVGRTLEMTASAVVHLDIDDSILANVAQLCAEHHAVAHHDQDPLPGVDEDRPNRDDPAAWRYWLHGLLERARTKGAIDHAWFRTYWLEGNAWTIWGGRPEGMPAFPKGVSRPAPPAVGGKSDGAYDRIAPGSWWEDWTRRTLGINKRPALDLVRLAFEQLTASGLLEQRATGTVPYWVLPAHRILVDDLSDVSAGHRELVCDVCSHQQVVAGHLVRVWESGRCLRFRCPGRLVIRMPKLDNYYRRFYRQGQMRRVVATPHTGQLDTASRKAVEEGFKSGGRPDAPNVLTATPTLEMGIDIGDLSAVMLTSMPRTQASHAQRIGRAGRRTGNSLVTTFAESDPMSLYYLAEPDAMIAGDISPPNCYLDATEILARHLLGYLVDRAADGRLDVGPAPQVANKLAAGWGAKGWLELLTDHAENEPEHVEAFLSQFEGHLAADRADWLRSYAAGGLRARIAEAISRWRDEDAEHARRDRRMGDAITELEAIDGRTGEQDARLKTLRGERGAVQRARRTLRRIPTLDALEGMGLMPNYTLSEDAVTFLATLWWQDDDGEFQQHEISTERSATIALTELAPGAVFYAGAYRLTIDGLEIGTPSAPLYQQIRTCPECAYATAHTDGDSVGTCPRCGTSHIADDGNVQTVLRPTTVVSLQPEADSRIYDERDDRTRVAFSTHVGVDVPPEHVQGTWKHHNLPFAFEYTDRATIRRLNLGKEHHSGGIDVRLAGQKRRAATFQVCRNCGIVAGVRPADRASGLEKHRAYCATRRGNTLEQWDAIVLGHDTTTEAVRILLPIADMEVDERRASFKALLLLGLRLSFGGDPDHLRAIVTDYPTGDPDQRQQLLVVHDTVTGGTGYVQRLADPEEMRTILTAARIHVATCPCRNEDKQACHRCLLGTADRREVPLVARRHALDVVDPILDDWGGAPVHGNVTGIDVGGIRQSELEQRFKRLLHRLDGHAFSDGVTATVASTPAPGGQVTFEIRIDRPDGTSRRWEIREQVWMSTTHHTQADFVATRLDDTSTPAIAVYLDGFAFHASATNNRLAQDTIRREELRDKGLLVWTATWDDVIAVENAWKESTSGAVPPSSAWPAGAVSVADAQFPNEQVRSRVAANPVETFLAFLADPDRDAWRLATRAAVLGWGKHATTSKRVVTAGRIADPDAAVAAWAAEATVPYDLTQPDSNIAFTVRSAGGLPVLLAVTQPPNGRIAVGAVLGDAASDLDDESHPVRWRAWLHLSNALQFLSTDGDSHTVTVDSLTDKVPAAPIAPTPAASSTPETVSPDDVVIPEVREKVQQAVDLGASVDGLVGGYETEDGQLIEAAWPGTKVGVIDPDVEDDGLLDWAAAHGWQLRTPDEWDASELATLTKDPS